MFMEYWYVKIKQLNVLQQITVHLDLKLVDKSYVQENCLLDKMAVVLTLGVGRDL